MKIQGIHFRNHKVLKNLKIDFTYNGKVRDLTVIAGANGSGKTNILRYIYMIILTIKVIIIILKKVLIFTMKRKKKNYLID